MTYDKIKAIIDNWDPIDLLSHAPKDEYNSESKQIYLQINRDMDESELGELIHDVFLKNFNSNLFDKSLLECREIAKQILKINNV